MARVGVNGGLLVSVPPAATSPSGICHAFPLTLTTIVVMIYDRSHKSIAPRAGAEWRETLRLESGPMTKRIQDATTRHKLSSGEMEMMGMLWREGAVTLAEAHQRLGKPIGYTTVQTRLNRLVDKGLVRRSRQRPARYEAAVSQDAISANHLDALLERVTDGNVLPLVAHLVNERSLSAEDLHEIKELIRAAEARLAEGEEKS